MTPIKSRAVRFLLAGIANTAFGYAVYAFFLYVNAPLWICVTGSLIGSLFFNFLTYGVFVFSGASIRRFILFFLFYIMITSLNLALLEQLIDSGMSALIAQLLLLIPIATLSYIGLNWGVFRIQRNGRHAS